MGLTGLIVEVTLRLRRVESPWIVLETVGVEGLEAMLAGLKRSAPDWPYTVGWIDCLAQGSAVGRGILMRGRHATAMEAAGRRLPRGLPLTVPLDAPEWLLNPLFMRWFNYGYYRLHGGTLKRRVVSCDRFFYPLDAVGQWNRLYGRRGFLQYQCVLPRAAGAAPLVAILDRLGTAGAASFLAVIKDCGPASDAYLSFPHGGHHAGARPRLPRRGQPSPDPRAERGGDRPRRARLPRQGRGDAGRGFRADDAAPGRVAGGARPLGSGPSLPLRPVRPAPRGPRVKVAFVGATRGMGRALARALAERGDALFLLGRDAAEMALSARDLEARGPRAPVGHAPLDLGRPAGFAEALDAADRALGGLDALVVTGGAFGRQEDLAGDPARLATLLEVNFTGTVLLCQQAAVRFAARGGGLICAFSSVAGDRARRGNYLYGASKAGLSAFLDGLDLAYRERGVRVLCVKPGFVRTAMTAGLPVPPFAGEPEAVAAAVVRAMDGGRHQVYAPGIWRWIMLVIRALPRAVLRRVQF